MIKFILSLIIMAGPSSWAEDCVVSSAKTEDIGEFLFVISDSLRIADAQFKLFEKTKKPDPTEGMIALKQMKSGFQCASDLISSYNKSKNENIKKSSTLMANGYGGWLELIDFLLVEYKKDLNLESVGGRGDFADSFSDKLIETRKKWQDVEEGVIVAVTSTVEENPTKKKNGRLLLTKDEHKRVKDDLISNFKFPIKKDKSTAAGEVAQGFYNFLNDKWDFKKTN